MASLQVKVLESATAEKGILVSSRDFYLTFVHSGHQRVMDTRRRMLSPVYLSTVLLVVSGRNVPHWNACALISFR